MQVRTARSKLHTKNELGVRRHTVQAKNNRGFHSQSRTSKIERNYVEGTKLETSLHPGLKAHQTHSTPSNESLSFDIKSFNRLQTIQSIGGASLSTPLSRQIKTMFTSKRGFTSQTNGNGNNVRGANLTGQASFIKAKVAELYENGHFPLNAVHSKYGPPYRDVKELETLPVDMYQDHIPINTLSDKIAYGLVSFFKQFTHLFFRDKYAHHAVVLETVAAVPGMVGGMWRHLNSLRRMERDHGWIGKLIEEAENERMHLLTWMQICQPSALERLVVIGAQLFYTPFYSLLYIFSPKTAHRFVGYLEEEACLQYTLFLKAIDDGKIPNTPAPEIAKKYWNLAPDATLRDVVLVVRADEAMHRDVNHTFSQKAAIGIH